MKQGNIALVESLLPTLERNGVTLAIENLYDKGVTDGNLTTAEDLLFYVDYFKSKNIGICLDTGHAIALNQDPIEMLNKVSKNLSAIHIHSSFPGKDMHFIPNLLCASDLIKWDSFYKVLINSEYRGAFNLELANPQKISGVSKDAIITFYKLAYQMARVICN